MSTKHNLISVPKNYNKGIVRVFLFEIKRVEEKSWVKICQYSFGGHTKDWEAGASGEGDPQTNAFTSEGIKPWALKVRVGLNCAGLLKIQQKHLFLPPDASDWSRCMLLLFIDVVCKLHVVLLLRCKYWNQTGVFPCHYHSIEQNTTGHPKYRKTKEINRYSGSGEGAVRNIQYNHK